MWTSSAGLARFCTSRQDIGRKVSAAADTTAHDRFSNLMNARYLISCNISYCEWNIYDFRFGKKDPAVAKVDYDDGFTSDEDQKGEEEDEKEENATERDEAEAGVAVEIPADSSEDEFFDVDVSVHRHSYYNSYITTEKWWNNRCNTTLMKYSLHMR